MLTALVNNIKKPAVQTEKIEAPFYCPYCLGEVGLRKGTKKIHHFYHIKENPDCLITNESELHLRIKYEMYNHFINQPNCKKCEPERILKRTINNIQKCVIPDISLYINDIPVAIEIQNSKISYEIIQQRMEIYNEMGIYVLWVLTSSSPSVDYVKRYEKVKFEYHNLKDWEKYLYDLYFHRLYYWQEKTTVKAFHFKKDTIKHDGGDFGPDYEYAAKKRASFIPYPDNLIIEKDFIKIQKYPRRVDLSYGPVIIPKVKVYKDKNTKWWDD